VLVPSIRQWPIHVNVQIVRVWSIAVVIIEVMHFLQARRFVAHEVGILLDVEDDSEEFANCSLLYMSRCGFVEVVQTYQLLESVLRRFFEYFLRHLPSPPLPRLITLQFL
jgi:hypothetical protein